MNKVYIVRNCDAIYNVFTTKEKAEEYVKLLNNPMNIYYNTDCTIEEYETKDGCLNEECYAVKAIVYADKYMKKTLDCVAVNLINGADMDKYDYDSDIGFHFSKRGYVKDMYYEFELRARFLKDNDSTIDEIKNRYIEMANKAFEKYVELIEQGAASEMALCVINEKLEEEMV